MEVSQFATVEQDNSPSLLERKDRQPAVTLTADALGRPSESNPAQSDVAGNQPTSQQTVQPNSDEFTVKQNNAKTPQEALEWSEKNSESIIQDYISKNGNILDPDIVREVFKKIGYGGRNVPLYRIAEKYMTEKIYDRMLRDAKVKTIVFKTGVGGSGKTKATTNYDLTKKGIIFDSAFNAFSSLDAVIKKALDKTFTRQ
ncbi:MAG: hypothetical protein Q7U47_15270 [Paludibacter sp.]|nr:hypothetical protein [Paludibacter sp.]